LIAKDEERIGGYTITPDNYEDVGGILDCMVRQRGQVFLAIYWSCQEIKFQEVYKGVVARLTFFTVFFFFCISKFILKKILKG
jgi:hypothetical protein